MKAQSELMGDHERTAEMTVPRFDGATNWIDGITDLTGAPASGSYVASLKERMESTMRITPNAGTYAAIFSSINKQENGVRNCPAGQKWPVCTP